MVVEGKVARRGVLHAQGSAGDWLGSRRAPHEADRGPASEPRLLVLNRHAAAETVRPPSLAAPPIASSPSIAHVPPPPHPPTPYSLSVCLSFLLSARLSSSFNSPSLRLSFFLAVCLRLSVCLAHFFLSPVSRLDLLIRVVYSAMFGRMNHTCRLLRSVFVTFD